LLCFIVNPKFCCFSFWNDYVVVDDDEVFLWSFVNW